MEKACILVVEDEKNIAAEIKSALENHNYIVISLVTTGEEAIKIVNNEKIDLVLMDIVLASKMKGTEAANIIWSKHNIPIIFLTGFLNKHLLEEAKTSEPLGYLLKPFNERELYASIEVALYKSKMEKQRRQFNSLLNISRKINRIINRLKSNNDFQEKIIKAFLEAPEIEGAGIFIQDDKQDISKAVVIGITDQVFQEIVKKCDAEPDTKRSDDISDQNFENNTVLHEETGIQEITLDNLRFLCVKFNSGKFKSGLLTINYNNADFTEEDCLLLKSIVNDIKNHLKNNEIRIKQDEMSRALAESESRYRQVVENASDIIFTTDRKGNFTYANKAGIKSSGFSLNEILKLNYVDLVLPEYKDNIIKFLLNQFITKKASDYIEYPFKTKSGEIKWFGQVSNLNFEKKKIKGFHCIARDITERKQMLQEIKNREHIMTTLLDSLPGFAYLKDNNSKYIIVNRKFSELMGYKKEQIIGKTDFELLPAEKASIYMEEDIRAVNNGETIIVDREIKSSNMEIFYVDSRKIPLKDEKGIVNGIIGLGFDITHRKTAEEAIKEYTKSLEALNKTKDKFFSIISHDLRSPFQGLLGLSDILVEDFESFEPEEIRTYLVNMNSSAKNLFNLIENLLHWSRIQWGDVKLKKEKINVYEEVLYVIGLLKGNADKKDIKLINEVPHNTFADCDINAIISVLQNLVSNAIKFTKRNGKVKIISKTNSNFVEVTVSDNGIGMCEKDVESLFRLDTHRSSAGTENERGTGLGLIISKELIEKQGGSILVKSRSNEGTAFTFTLPISQ